MYNEDAEMDQQGYRAGQHDWVALWRQMYDQERAQAERITAPEFTTNADFWAGQAPRMAAISRQAVQPDGFMRFLLPRLRPTDGLLDIGAGAGRYEPTLAAAVAEVLALEPSPAMREQLETRLAEAELSSEQPASAVRVVAASWPWADAPPCDVAIAAHVLYGVREIAPFLRAMDAVARRACFLLLAYRHPLSFLSAFWERIHGEPRLPLPGALECLNALYQLGIPAQLALTPVSSQPSYADLAEALADIRWRLRCLPDPQRNRAIEAAAAEFMDRDAEGRLVARGLPEQVAVIWWERAC
jgi:2-polyprenyl-3-methyl-5-hydroxy-6-metoxy-1,4-benzoquinol methylase